MPFRSCKPLVGKTRSKPLAVNLCQVRETRTIQVLHSLQRPGANPTKSRLAIFSDCCAVERDVMGVATTAKKIGYPICVVAITGGSYALGAKKYMPNASFIQTSGQTSSESVWKVMQVFSKWMADPVTFYRSIQKTGGIYLV